MASTGVETKAGYSTSSISTSEPVVSVDWLHTNLREPGLKVTALCASSFLEEYVCHTLKLTCFYSTQILDASWYMPDEQRNPIQEYQVRV